MRLAFIVGPAVALALPGCVVTSTAGLLYNGAKLAGPCCTILRLAHPPGLTAREPPGPRPTAADRERTRAWVPGCPLLDSTLQSATRKGLTFSPA